MPEVTLSNGDTVTVQPVPPFTLTVAEARHPIPENLDAEETRAAMAERERVLREVAWLVAFEDLQVPDDWSFPRGLQHAGTEPREGDEGRLLDYVEYSLLKTPSDIQQVQKVMYGEALTEAEVDAAASAFPADSG